jgi:hypothetical protein
MDAMGCQRYIAARIMEKEADCLLSVKGNQGAWKKMPNELFASQTVGQTGIHTFADGFVKMQGGSLTFRRDVAKMLHPPPGDA